LLHDLRIVLLQDSVQLRKLFSTHRIWQEPVFRTDKYAEFETELQATLPVGQPQDRRLEAAIPLVASTLNDG